MGDLDELLPGYRARDVELDEFDALREAHWRRFYPDLLSVSRDVLGAPGTEELRAARTADARSLLRRQFVVEDASGRFCGWCSGAQGSPGMWRMVNSVVAPEHRRRGVYTAMLERACSRARDDGFAVAQSHHHPTNTAVLVAKLKAGFFVSGYELSVGYGTLVVLERPLTEAYAELFAYRCGAAPLSADLARRAGLEPLRERT